jgi:hypothetical protein
MASAVYGLSRIIHNRINHLSTKTLKPSEFCQTYIKLNPDERGYRTASVKLLSRVLNAPIKTIQKWWDIGIDNCPVWVYEVLKREHALRQIQMQLDRISDSD